MIRVVGDASSSDLVSRTQNPVQRPGDHPGPIENGQVPGQGRCGTTDDTEGGMQVTVIVEDGDASARRPTHRLDARGNAVSSVDDWLIPKDQVSDGKGVGVSGHG